MNRIKIAFIGGGINSAIGRTHRIAIEMDKRYELVAGCFSRDININSQTAEEYGVDRLYNNIDDLISAEKNSIDAICVLTPTPDHKDIVLKCIKNNISVICEKALASSSVEILEIQEALNKYKALLVVTYNYTGYPMVRELRSMIRDNKLGKIEQIHIEMPQESFAKLDKDGNPQIPQKWRLSDTFLPTMSLDLGTHTHDLASFLIEERPTELVAIQNSFGSFSEVVDNSISIARYTNDIVSNVWFSKCALGHTNGLRVRVYGKEASAMWYQLEPEYIYFCDNRGNKSIIDRANNDVSVTSEYRYNRFKAGHPSGFIEAFANYYGDIADYFLGLNKDENRFLFGIENALEGLRMLEAMTISNNTKQWVSI